MTILKWKRKHKLSYPKIAKMLHMDSKSAKLNVIRHAHGINGMSRRMMCEYVRISKGEKTFEDLCRSPIRRRKAA